MTRFSKPAAAVAVAVFLGTASFALAQGEPLITATHTATLEGGDFANTNGTGTALLAFDAETNALRWMVEYEELTGPATGAHIHGPAQPGEIADVLIDLGGGGLEVPIEGEVMLTAEQVDQLLNGLWYVNIHTEAYPDGEIRGQVEAVQP
jgi:hypothetical protein